MPRATWGVVVSAGLLAISVLACKTTSWKAEPSASFFPLKPNMMWMYKVESKSQRENYVVTDMVVGERYVPALKLTGAVVEEFYNLDRAGVRPIVYTENRGYLTRLSGLDYIRNEIKPPPWGRSVDEDFLPQRLTPDLAWNNQLFPYGKLPGAFQIAQSHKTFVENREVRVPAGQFRDCILIETNAQYIGGAYAQQHQLLKLAYRDWYAPNVGLVRTIAYQNSLDGPEMERVELIKFAPGEKRSAKLTLNQDKKS